MIIQTLSMSENESLNTKNYKRKISQNNKKLHFIFF